MQPITYNAGRPVSVTLRLPSDRNNGIDRDLGLFLQDKWALGRVTLNLGLRYDQFIGESRESKILANRFTAETTFGECGDGHVPVPEDRATQPGLDQGRAPPGEPSESLEDKIQAGVRLVPRAQPDFVPGARRDAA